MNNTCTLAEAHAAFDALMSRVTRSRERIAITDQGLVAAVLINPLDLADLEDALAVAEYQLSKERGTLKPAIPHDEVRRLLGLR
ncbi:type II toxin-antitoxin system prevent-host-death family antitoxin [Streptomyces sp. NPDC059743]|uniref:type II toxin-antitoxin system prevent-host-death family antitoxin n=1 Tax=Streptomyces sp. NPDC059743 TaxID=3346928 RepID=UPI00365B6AF7